MPSVRIADGTLHFALGAFGISYRGALAAEAATISGEWTQGGLSVPVRLTRSTAPQR